jgi:hypothetical protein
MSCCKPLFSLSLRQVGQVVRLIAIRAHAHRGMTGRPVPPVPNQPLVESMGPSGVLGVGGNAEPESSVDSNFFGLGNYEAVMLT